MAWTAPRTWVALETVTAALLNTHLRDNLLETAPAKAVAAGDTFYATGANSLSRLAAGGAYKHPRQVVGNNALEYDEVGVLYRVKSADESVISSVTLQNDNHLVFPILANEVWFFEFFLWVVSASPTPDFRWDFTYPAAVGDVFRMAIITPPSGSFQMNSSDAGAGYWNNIVGTGGAESFISRILVNNGANAGNVTLQWAQDVSTATTTIVKKGSFAIGYKVA